MKKIRNHKIWIAILIVITLITNISIVIAQEYNGYISNVSPSSFEGGVETTVTVTAYNSGESGTLIVDPQSWPSGWDIDDNEFDGNDDIQIYVSSGSYGYFDFYITSPEDGGSGTIIWDLYYDRTWPYSNVLLDTYSQYVNANPTTNYNGVINSVSPSSFNGGVESAVEVVVYNYGDSGTLIVDPVSVPSGNDDLQIYVASGSSETFEFYITPPDNGGSGTISWKLYYDIQWPDPNILLDTYSQSVIATEGTNYNGVINSVSPNSFNGGEETTVEVLVYNYGDSGTLIVNDDLQIYVASGSSETFEFYITPPDNGGSGTISWKLYYDIQWPNENIPLDTHSQSVSATEGNYNAVINSITPNSFNGGEKNTVQISVYNYGNTGNLIVDPTNWPDEWTIDDGEIDGNDDIQIIVPSGSSQTFTFYITPPEMGGSGTITWDLYYDIQWPDANILLDTYTQSVTSSGSNYEADIIDVTPSTFTGNIGTSVTVRVYNTGEDATLLVYPDIWPYGWKIDDNEFDGNDYIKKDVASGSYENFIFTVTPPSTVNAETIIWKLYYNIQWPDEDVLLDSYSQSISSSGIESIADFYFIHMTDVHIQKGNEKSTKNFDNCIEYINNLNPAPDFVIITGDCVEIGNAENFQEFDRYLKKLNVPYYTCPGNHDYYDAKWRGKSGISEYYKYIDSRDNYYFQHKNTFFISLNSGYDDLLNPCIPYPPTGTGLDDLQISWLDDQLDLLDGNPNDRDDSDYNKIVYMHHPVINPGSEDFCRGLLNDNIIDFINICDKYNVDVVLTGHTHDDEIYDKYGFIKNGYDNEDTIYIQTDACIEGGKFRKIVVQNEKVIVCDTTILTNHNFFRVFCPVDIYLIDENGRKVGIESSEIENVYYDSVSYGDYDEKNIIVYGHIGEYSIYIEGEDEGEFRLEVSTVSTEKREVFEYENVSVNKGSKANILVKDGSIDSNMVLDYDGDGIDDQQISPTNTYIEIVETPTILISYPLDLDKISNTCMVKGIAQPENIIKVEIRIDNGDWITVDGKNNWEYELPIDDLEPGKHMITARVWNGNEYSYDSINVIKETDVPGFELILVFCALAFILFLKRKRQ